jgi:hypothetical protein
MLVHQCKLKMKVYFGRENGEKTLAEVIKMNPARAKVKTLEQRGHGRGSTPGSVWTVAYQALTVAPADAKAGQDVFVPPPVPTKLEYSPFDEDNALYSALAGVYNQMEPDALTCDGEASRGQAAAKMRVLQRKLKGLNYAIGREIDAMAIFNWEIARLEYERKNAPASIVAPPGVEFDGHGDPSTPLVER